jgi:hypothetical protein
MIIPSIAVLVTTYWQKTAAYDRPHQRKNRDSGRAGNIPRNRSMVASPEAIKAGLSPPSLLDRLTFSNWFRHL